MIAIKLPVAKPALETSDRFTWAGSHSFGFHFTWHCTQSMLEQLALSSLALLHLWVGNALEMTSGNLLRNVFYREAEKCDLDQNMHKEFILLTRLINESALHPMAVSWETTFSRAQPEWVTEVTMRAQAHQDLPWEHNSCRRR